MRLTDDRPEAERPGPDETPELTGEDATMDEARAGEAGDGADPWGGDFEGGPPRSIEDEPGEHDIAPDRIEQLPGYPTADELDERLTVRPLAPSPIDPSEV